MPWWLKLLKAAIPENLLDIDIDALNSLEKIELKVASDNTINKTEQTIINNGTLIIQPVLKSNEKIDLDKILAGLAPDKINVGDTVVEESSSVKLVRIGEVLSSKDSKDQMERFRSVVPSKDLPILEAAIVVQALYENGQNVDEYVRDIAIKYGRRGSMICHLYSAGYYDEVILPLYKSIVENNPSGIDEFNDVYETIIEESPLAIFVNRMDTFETLKKTVLKKIKLNKEISLNSLNIHGIGRSNISLINRVLADKDVQKELSGEPVSETKKEMTTVAIFF